MAKTANKKQKKVTNFTIKHSGFNMSNIASALANINAQLTKKQKKNIQMASRRSTRQTLPVSRYVPAVSSSRRSTQKKSTKKSTKKNTNKKNTVVTKQEMNVIMEEPIVAVKTRKPQTIRAKQLAPIMRTYEGKAGKENKYAYFKSIKNMYNARKNNYGFGPETNIKNIMKIMEEKPANNVNELAALLGETRMGNNNNL
jgi:hypothetical protein